MVKKICLKFCILVEVENKYVVNILPYLRAQNKDAKQRITLAQRVVAKWQPAEMWK